MASQESARLGATACAMMLPMFCVSEQHLRTGRSLRTIESMAGTGRTRVSQPPGRAPPVCTRRRAAARPAGSVDTVPHAAGVCQSHFAPGSRARGLGAAPLDEQERIGGNRHGPGRPCGPRPTTCGPREAGERAMPLQGQMAPPSRKTPGRPTPPGPLRGFRRQTPELRSGVCDGLAMRWRVSAKVDCKSSVVDKESFRCIT